VKFYAKCKLKIWENVKKYLKYKLVIWKRIMICLNKYEQWVEILWVLLGIFPWKLWGTSEVELTIEIAYTIRMPNRCSSPHLFIYRNIFVKIFVYIWNELWNRLWKSMWKELSWLRE